MSFLVVGGVGSKFGDWIFQIGLGFEGGFELIVLVLI